MRRLAKPPALWSAVVTSDWHLDKHTAGFPRFADVEAAVQLAVNDAIETRADFLFLGDLTDPDSVSAHRCVERAAAWAEQLASNEVDSTWVAGNHDTVEDGTGKTTLSPIAGAFGSAHLRVAVASSPSIVENDAVTIVCLPFPTRATSYDPEDVLASVASNRPLLVLAHLIVEGAGVASETLDMPRGRDVAFPWRALAEHAKRVPVCALNGHYHRAQTVQNGAVSVHVPGAPERMTFGEVGHDPGYLRVELTKQGFSVERVSFNSRPMYVVSEDHPCWSGSGFTVEPNAGALVRVAAPASATEQDVERVRRSFRDPAAVHVTRARPTSRETVEAARSVEADATPRQVATRIARERGGPELEAVVADILDAAGA